MLMLATLVLLLDGTLRVTAEIQIVHQTVIDERDVIKVQQFTTVTSCYMSCMCCTEGCVTIGFKKSLDEDQRDCFMLRDLDAKSALDRNELFPLELFVLLNESATIKEKRKCKIIDNCKDALEMGMNTVKLAIDGQTQEVGCKYNDTQVLTTFSHNAESKRAFNSKNYNQYSTIVYTNTFEFVRKASRHFQACRQRFYITQVGNAPGSSYFESADGIKIYASNDDCIGCEEIIINVNKRHSGYAYIGKRNLLPLKGMRFKDNDDSVENLQITLDKLVCW